MKRTGSSPIDIVAIVLGALACLVVAGSIVGIAVGGASPAGLPLAGGALASPWDGGASVRGGELSGGGTESREEERTFEGAFTEVEIRTVAGTIDVIGSDGGSLRVRSVKKALTRAGLEGLRAEVREVGNRLVIEEKRDTPSSGWQRSISFTVTVPRTVKVLRARTVSGAIRVQGAAGADQWLDSVSGSIATDGAADLYASSTSGSVDFAFAGKVLDCRTVSGSLEGSIDAVDKGGSLSLRSVSGSVRALAFEGLDATVDLRSVSGSVSCDFPLTVVEQKRTRLAGRIGQGSIPVLISTTSGTIRIARK